MTISLKYFVDAALITELPGNLIIEQASDGSTGPVDVQLFLGSTAVGKKFQAQSDPGIDSIILTVVDANPGFDHEKEEVKLATTLLGLDIAVAGDPLNVGTEIFSGVGNAQDVFMRIDDATMVIGTAVELSVDANNLVEVDV